MPVELAPSNPYGLRIESPVMVAAGCLGYGIEPHQAPIAVRTGALVTPTTSLRGRRFPRPKLIETPGGMLYSGGWPERGMAYVLDRCAPIWSTWRTPVLLSLSAADRDAASAATQLEGLEGIAGIELDVSQAPDRGVAALTAVRAVTLLPILVKLPACEVGLADLARALVAAGADTLVVAAPPAALWLDPRTGERVEGRLCGPAWRPLALRLVSLVVEATDAPVIGCGGVADTAGARQMLAAGARAVQIGTALLTDPELAARIAEELG